MSNLQSLVKLFNQHSKSTLLPTKKCSDLKEEKHYIIHHLRKIDTSLGEGVLAALSEAPFKEGNDAQFQVFLPKRFVTILQNEDLNAISPGKLYLVSHGQSGSNSTELSLHMNTSHTQ